MRKDMQFALELQIAEGINRMQWMLAEVLPTCLAPLRSNADLLFA